VGGLHSLIFFTLSSSDWIPCLFTLCPINLISFKNHWHLVIFIFKFAPLILFRTFLTCLLWLFLSFEKMMISSKYTATNFLRYSLRTSFINLWKVAGALFNPN